MNRIVTAFALCVGFCSIAFVGCTKNNSALNIENKVVYDEEKYADEGEYADDEVEQENETLSNASSVAKVDENERAMSHINYIQYELAKIRKSANKIVATRELDNVLGRIEPTSLKHDELIRAYEKIQNFMIEIRATDEQKDALADELAQKRKNAIFNSFSGLGAAFLNPNPVSLVSALVMSGFNYARTVGEIDVAGKKETLKLVKTQRDRLDKQRGELWSSAARVFKDSKYESTTFITDEMMKNYIDEEFRLERALGSKKAAKEAKEVYTYLSDSEIENQFRFFIPYYVTLLKTGYAENKTSRVKKYYKKILELSNAEYRTFYTKNPYLYEATKYALLYLMAHNLDDIDGVSVEKMIEIIKKEGDKSRIAVVEDDYFLVGIYEYLETKNSGQYYGEIKNVLKHLVGLGMENDTTDLYSKYKCLESASHDNKYCRRLEKKIAQNQYEKSKKIAMRLLEKSEYRRNENGDFIILLPFDAEVYANCADRIQETIIWGAFDRQDERKRCNEAVENFQKLKVKDMFAFIAEGVFPLEHEKINIFVDFKMGEWIGRADGVMDWKGVLTKKLELKEFE